MLGQFFNKTALSNTKRPLYYNMIINGCSLFKKAKFKYTSEHEERRNQLTLTAQFVKEP